MSATLLVADDDQTIRSVVGRALTRFGFRVRTTANASTLWHWAADGEGDLIITDVALPDGDGLDLVPNLKRLRPELKIIVISAQNALATAVKAEDAGAFAFLPKPFDLKELVQTVNKALAETTVPQTKVPVQKSPKIIGRSPEMKRVMRQLSKLVSNDKPLLIQGSVGTGKSLIARELFRLSKPQQATLRVCNDLDQLSQTLQTANANGATILFEGVDNLNDADQQQFLKLLSTGFTSRLICTASNALSQGLKAQTFRRDLYDQLAVFSLTLPALKEREDDITPLVEHFQAQLGTKLIFSPEAIELLKSEPWPGNVRQLENLISRLALYSDDAEINASHLRETLDAQALDETQMIAADDFERLVTHWLHAQNQADNQSELHGKLLAAWEKPLIEQVLKSCGNNQIKASAVLGLNRNTLRKKISEHGIELTRKT